MAAVDVAAPKAGKKPGGLKRMKRRVAIRIDMTPMVDIAFLLLIFFMVTTVFRAPQALEINLPPSKAKVEVPESNVLTMRIIGDGKIFWAVATDPFKISDLQNIGTVLKEEIKKNPKLITLVKIDRACKYSVMVDTLDELGLAGIDRFSLAPLEDAEKKEVEELQ
jgi:biopolymer transport protein ExbD